MYSFSSMRRNSTIKDHLTTGLFLLSLVFYNFLSSMYLFLPPLFGVLFLYFLGLVRDCRYYTLGFFIFILFIFEADKGFYPGILFVIYALVYMFLFPRIAKMFDNFNIFEILYVPVIYVSYFLINFAVIFFYDHRVDIWSSIIVSYILIESILFLVIRWIFGIK